MRKGGILIISYNVPVYLTKNIVPGIEHAFEVPVTIREGYLDLNEFYDPARRQYNGNHLIGRIDKDHGSDTHKTLAIFNVDLFIPILTYIFGQAYLRGRTGIASINRLMNERYGLPKNDDLLASRLQKEIIHELGHTFGLIHCHEPYCVMRSSTYVEDIDQKMALLCNNCRAQYAI